MNYGIILLAVLLLLAGIEVWVGIKRGGPFVGLRFVLWALMTVVAALITKPIARAIVKALLNSQGMEGASPYELAQAMLSESGLGVTAEIFGVPLAGLMLSLFAPFVFVVLFLFMKFFSWILFIIAKKIINKQSFAPVFSNMTTPKKVIGGVAGFLIGVLSCAIIASPISGLIKTIDDSGAVESAFHIAEIATEKVTGEETAESSATEEVSADLSDGMSIADARKMYNSFVHSPASYVCRFTGTEWIAMKIYNGISTVTPKQVGAVKDEPITYSFPVALANLLSIANKIDRSATLIHDGKGYCPELVDSFEDIAFYFLDGKLMTDSDKLTMLNASLDTIENAFEEAIGIGDEKRVFKPFDSYEVFREDVRTIFAIARIPASLTTQRDNNKLESVFDLTPLMLVENERFLEDLIHLMFKLNSGPESLASLLNSVAPKYGEITTADKIKAGGEEKVKQACKDLVFLLNMKKEDVTVDNYKEYQDAYDRLNGGGLIKIEIEIPKT